MNDAAGIVHECKNPASEQRFRDFVKGLQLAGGNPLK
jgi:hypothetical protein